MKIEEELAYYEDMLEVFQDYSQNRFTHKYILTSSGFCWYLHTHTVLSLDKLKILSSLKPEKIYDYKHWFKPYVTSPRIRLIKKAIKICKTQIKLNHLNHLNQ